MKNVLLTVGKPKADYIAQGLANYQKRLKSFGGCAFLPVKPFKAAKGIKDQAVKEKEGENILARINPNDHVWTLDTMGKPWSSEKWSENLEKARLQAPSRLVLVVGGALGLAETVIERAQLSVSLGPITLPHELAALVAIEQLYRAYSILAGSPYHKA